jgi:hypothetical protein
MSKSYARTKRHVFAMHAREVEEQRATDEAERVMKRREQSPLRARAAAAAVFSVAVHRGLSRMPKTSCTKNGE